MFQTKVLQNLHPFDPKRHPDLPRLRVLNDHPRLLRVPVRPFVVFVSADGRPTARRLADGSRHLYPLKDAVEHQPTDDCPCGPSSALNPDADEDQWLYRHHPLTQPDITRHLED